MSRSPPRQWSGYHPQGSAVGPPPMPNKQGRSPDRERRPSPGYDREAEFRRFQEWEKRNRKSPQPSPRRERSPPPNWVRQSPPRAQPNWGRRSPPNWGRRSPPRYAPSRGRSPARPRSPPRGRTPPRSRSPPRTRSPPRWRAPPPEWDRYRFSRRSPPRYGPPAHWEQRRPPPPHENRWPQQTPPSKAVVSKPNGVPSAPTPTAESRRSPDQIKMEDSTEDENFENYDLPEYDAEVPLGQKYVIAVSGFFCKICHKFYNSESSAKITHCKSKSHYDKFVKWVGDKKEEALAEKQKSVPEAPAPVPAPTAPPTVPVKEEESLEPPAKIPRVQPPSPIKKESVEQFAPELVVKEEVKDSDNETTEIQYDPSEPTVEEECKPVVDEQAVPSEHPSESGHESSENASDSASAVSSDFVEATLYNFRKMKVSELKENLKKRNLPLHGLKPLLLKRLEKALVDEAKAATVADAEDTTQEEQQDETKVEPEIPAEVKEDSQAEDTPQETVSEGDPKCVTEVKLVMHESDIEVSNQKKQWITDRELDRELSQVSGVVKVKSIDRQENKMGKKTIVEWKITVDFDGEFPPDGVNFHMESHQQLPFRAEICED